MRELFISEQRYIRNILLRWTKTELQSFDPVVLEYYEPPRSSTGIRFNNDFLLLFVNREDIKNFKAYGATILPNTIGADIFLAVDKDTYRPLRTELIAGEAFSINYYKKFIKQIEDKLEQLSHKVWLRKCAYLRIFVIENDICFLAFPNETTPIAKGKITLLCSDCESTIECSREDNGIIYYDGWIHTNVKYSERKLVATAE